MTEIILSLVALTTLPVVWMWARLVRKTRSPGMAGSNAED